jgi:hypothetical protein
MNVSTNYYSVRGSDSVELSNDKVGFTFKEELDGNGRVRQLTRYDGGGNRDEIHLFEYNKNGYTVEVVAHGAGTIHFSRYTKLHDLVEQIESSTDTFHLTNNELGRLQKIAREQGGIIKDIAIVESDDKKIPSLLRSLDDSSRIMKIMYNDKGLPIEISRIRIKNSEEQIILRTVYSYKFYKN